MISWNSWKHGSEFFFKFVSAGGFDRISNSFFCRQGLQYQVYQRSCFVHFIVMFFYQVWAPVQICQNIMRLHLPIQMHTRTHHTLSRLHFCRSYHFRGTGIIFSTHKPTLLMLYIYRHLLSVYEISLASLHGYIAGSMTL